MLNVEHLSKTFFPGSVNEKKALLDVNLKMETGDFITVIGGNGAGKSTLLNSVAGVFPIDKGTITIDNQDVTKLAEHQRAQYIGRVFQDPMLGTAAGMMIEENLSIAARRGKKPGFAWALKDEERDKYRTMLAELDLGLEERLTARVGLLSGGQRQALTLLMATMRKPKLLLLDEHTAALDPKTAEKVLTLTKNIIAKNNLTTLMITHNMKDALRFGNRLIMMNAGRIVVDVKGEEKSKLSIGDLLNLFERAAGEALDNDRILLG
jgi:putative ABC transport system ATP-binding protein